MDKKKLWIIIGAVVAVLVLCAVLVGVLHSCDTAGGQDTGSNISGTSADTADDDSTDATDGTGADDDAESTKSTDDILVEVDDGEEDDDATSEYRDAIDFDELLEKANGGN